MFSKEVAGGPVPKDLAPGGALRGNRQGQKHHRGHNGHDGVQVAGAHVLPDAHAHCAFGEDGTHGSGEVDPHGYGPAEQLHARPHRSLRGNGTFEFLPCKLRKYTQMDVERHERVTPR